MNRIFPLVCLGSLLFTRFLCADDSSGAPTELKELQARYKSDVQDAITPVKDRYLDNLKDLLKLELDKGDADAAFAVKSEIKRVEAESPFSGKWSSQSNGVSIIQFKSEGKFVEDWNGSSHYGGRWQMDEDGAGAVVKRSDGYVLHYKINAQGHLIRDNLGSVDYIRTNDQ